MYMHNRPRNHPNALKHGAFAKMVILPWEDPQEFEKLHAALIDEWKPVGPTEHDAVLSIAKGMWRKRRMQYFLWSESQKRRAYPNHPAYDEAKALGVFSYHIDVAPDEVDIALRGLSARNANHLRQKFPQGDFQSTSEWVDAIQEEVTSVLLPAAERFGFDRSTEALIARDAAFFTVEVVKDELAVDERIEAMIDRAVKRLVQTKAIKQMLGTTSPDARTDRTKKLPSNKPDGSTKIVSKKQNGRRSDNRQEATGTEEADAPSS
jgi:hypothetical protein